MSARASKPTPGLTFGAEPRANLLPPEVAESAKARRTRGVLVALVITSLVIVLAGYAYATLRAVTAQNSLAEAQARTQTLLDERAQYSDTIAITSAVGVVTEVQRTATSTEVIWAEVFDQITLQMPPNTYVKWSGLATPPWLSPLSASGPLRGDRVATLEVTVAGPTPFDTTALYRKILSIDGVSDLSIDLVEKPEGTTDYETTITVNVSRDGLSDRWTDEEATDEGE